LITVARADPLTYNLKPVENLACQLHNRLMDVEECRVCEYCEDIRQPWYSLFVKCIYPDDPTVPELDMSVAHKVFEV